VLYYAEVALLQEVCDVFGVGSAGRVCPALVAHPSGELDQLLSGDVSVGIPLNVRRFSEMRNRYKPNRWLVNYPQFLNLRTAPVCAEVTMEQ